LQFIKRFARNVKISLSPSFVGKGPTKRDCKIIAVALLLGFLFCPLKLEGLESVSFKASQNPFYYLNDKFDQPVLPSREQEVRADRARGRFFLPWTEEGFRHSKEDLLWPFKAYLPGRVYDEAGTLRPKGWFEELYDKANVGAFGSVNAPGVTLAEADLRSFPTCEPAFLSPDLPGEGYPFDYGQVSHVNAGEPIRISHFSADSLWAYVETSFAAGWIDVGKIAYVNEEAIKKCLQMPMAVAVKDNKTASEDGRILFNVKVGALFPLNKELLYELEVLVPTGKDKKGFAMFDCVRLPKETVKRWPVEFTQWNAATLINEMIGESYGWGGLFGKRDCSATTRDFFLPFGVWLPRNSRAQAESGSFISLDGLTGPQKERLIIERGTPFASLLYKPGHIMLYVGTYRGKAIVFHNLWGIKTYVKGKEGRYVIGRSVLSTLDIGNGFPDIRSEDLLINNVTGLTNLL